MKEIASRATSCYGYGCNKFQSIVSVTFTISELQFIGTTLWSGRFEMFIQKKKEIKLE